MFFPCVCSYTLKAFKSVCDTDMWVHIAKETAQCALSLSLSLARSLPRSQGARVSEHGFLAPSPCSPLAHFIDFQLKAFCWSLGERGGGAGDRLSHLESGGGPIRPVTRAT